MADLRSSCNERYHEHFLTQCCSFYSFSRNILRGRDWTTSSDCWTIELSKVCVSLLMHASAQAHDITRAREHLFFSNGTFRASARVRLLWWSYTDIKTSMQEIGSSSSDCCSQASQSRSEISKTRTRDPFCITSAQSRELDCICDAILSPLQRVTTQTVGDRITSPPMHFCELKCHCNRQLS